MEDRGVAELLIGHEVLPEVMFRLELEDKGDGDESKGNSNRDLGDGAMVEVSEDGELSTQPNGDTSDQQVEQDDVRHLPRLITGSIWEQLSGFNIRLPLYQEHRGVAQLASR